MSEEKTETLSKFNYWMITSIIGAGIIGFIAWASYMHTATIDQKIAMAEMKATVDSMDQRMRENLELTKEIHLLKSDLNATKLQVGMNTQNIQATSRIMFNMTDYDKYVKPVQDDVLARLNKLETRMELSK